MRFIVDNAISRAVSEGLKQAGHDSVHVGEIGLSTAEDEAIFFFAEAENRIIISSDADFGALMAAWNKTKPSIVLFRSGVEKRPTDQLKLLHANLPAIQEQLEEGSLVVFEPTRIRVRKLPIWG